MNQLPKVVREEIFQYARGDKSHWKAKFTDVMDELEAFIAHVQVLGLIGFPMTRTWLLAKAVKSNQKWFIISNVPPFNFSFKSTAIFQRKRFNTFYKGCTRTDFAYVDSLLEYSLILSTRYTLDQRNIEQHWLPDHERDLSKDIEHIEFCEDEFGFWRTRLLHKLLEKYPYLAV